MTNDSNASLPLAYSVADACRVSSIGKTKLYALVGEGRLEMVRIGRRSLITADSLRRLLASPS